MLLNNSSRKNSIAKKIREIYQFCPKHIPYNTVRSLIHEALILEQFTFAPVEHTEIIAIKKWV